MHRIRCLVSAGKPSSSNSWTENSFSVRWRAGMFTGKVGTWGLVEEALWFKIKMKCRWVVGAVRDGVLPLPDDTNATRLLVSALQRCLSSSESVQQQQMLMQSCEPETPVLYIHATTLWNHQERMGDQRRWVRNFKKKKKKHGATLLNCCPFKQGDPACQGLRPYYGHDFINVGLSSVGRH